MGRAIDRERFEDADYERFGARLAAGLVAMLERYLTRSTWTQPVHRWSLEA